MARSGPCSSSSSFRATPRGEHFQGLDRPGWIRYGGGRTHRRCWVVQDIFQDMDSRLVADAGPACPPEFQHRRWYHGEHHFARVARDHHRLHPSPGVAAARGGGLREAAAVAQTILGSITLLTAFIFRRYSIARSVRHEYMEEARAELERGFLG